MNTYTKRKAIEEIYKKADTRDFFFRFKIILTLWVVLEVLALGAHFMKLPNNPSVYTLSGIALINIIITFTLLIRWGFVDKLNEGEKILVEELETKIDKDLQKYIQKKHKSIFELETIRYMRSNSSNSQRPQQYGDGYKQQSKIRVNFLKKFSPKEKASSNDNLEKIRGKIHVLPDGEYCYISC